MAHIKIASLGVISTIAALSASALPANAAGFYIQESSISSLGSAFSGSTTSIDDASTIFFNPAGMTDLSGAQISAGANVLIPNADIKDTGGSTLPPGITATTGSGNPYDPAVVPNFFAATPVNGDQLWLGLGVSAPFGLVSEYDQDWFGRYDSTETELTTINASFVSAYKVNDMLSIGGGVDVQYADADLKSAIYFGGGPALEGVSRLEGDDISFGYNIGATLKPAEGTELGVHYRSAISHELDGTISATGTAADFNIDGTADLDLPDIATFGVSQDINDKLTLMGQATWFGWNNFQDITARDNSGAQISSVVQNYQTTWAFAIGAEYDYSDKWTFRAGYQHDETPTTDTYRTSRTPDGDRNWFTTGATYTLNDKISLDMAAAYIDISDETINETRNDGASPLLASNVSATTGGDVGIISFGVNYKF